VVKIQSGSLPSILQGECIPKKISFSAINISLWVIELRKKNGSYSVIFKAIEGKLLCLKFNLEAGLNLTGRLHPEKDIILGHKHLASDKRIAKKEGFLLVVARIRDFTNPDSKLNANFEGEREDLNPKLLIRIF
jgi:hypothetical protein